MAVVRFNLLGAAEIDTDDRPEPLRLGPKPLQLLAFLLLSGDDVHTRESLAALLWPRRFESQAKQSLRQALVSIRKRLGDVQNIVITDGNTVCIDTQRCTSDCAELEKALSLDPQAAGEQVRLLWRGEFLEGIANSDVAAGQWLVAERTRLRQLAVSLLRRAAAHATPVSAVRFSEMAADLNSSDPEIQKELLHALIATGDIPRALYAFDSFAARLASEGEAVPEDLSRLRDEIWANLPEADPKLDASTAMPGSVSPRAEERGRRMPIALAAAGLVAAIVAGIGFVSGPERAPNEIAATCEIGNEAVFPGKPAILYRGVQLLDVPDAALSEVVRALDNDLRSALLLVSGITIIEGPPRDHPDAQQDRRLLADQLAASHVLSGSVQQVSDQKSLRLSLYNGGTGAVEWEDTWALPADTAELFDERTVPIIGTVREIQSRFSEGPQARLYPSAPAMSFDVFKYNTRAYGLMNRVSRTDNLSARKEYMSALAIDPDDPSALSGMAWTYLMAVFFSWSADPAGDLTRAAEYAKSSTEANDEYPYAYSVLSLVSLMRGNHAEAVRLSDLARQRSPSNGDPVALASYVYSYSGLETESLTLARQALRLKPYAKPAWYRWILGRARRLNGDSAGALACLPDEEVLRSGALMPMLERQAALTALDRNAEARALTPILLGSVRGHVTAESLCQTPPWRNKQNEKACISTLRQAGLP